MTDVNMPNPNAPANKARSIDPATPPPLTLAEREQMRGDWEALTAALSDGRVTLAEVRDLAQRAWAIPWPKIFAIIKYVMVGLGLIGGITGGVVGVQTVMTKDDVKPVTPTPTPKADPLLVAIDSLGGKIDVLAAKMDARPKPPKPGPVDPSASVLPVEVSGKVGEPLFVTASFAGELRWIVPPDAPTFSREFGLELMLVPKVDGQFRIGLATIAGGKIAPIEWMLVKVGKAPRPPPEPVPEPPKPTPPIPVTDGPFPLDGLRVLIVYESAKTLPMGQNSVIYGKKVRDYLREKCIKGPDGKTSDFRIYDQDLDVSGDGAHWQKAMVRTRTTVPWIVIGGRTAWHEGPLPGSVEEALALLKKYGD
jgi:hypothetical protein